jgi:hypothetical protein
MGFYTVIGDKITHIYTKRPLTTFRKASRGFPLRRAVKSWVPKEETDNEHYQIGAIEFKKKKKQEKNLHWKKLVSL